MAPTICSEKKRQTRTIATSNIRRHGQGAHQMNQAFSNIVNFVARDSKVPASLRIQINNQMEDNLSTTGNYHSANIEADLMYNYLIQTSATSASNHRLQRHSFLTDNAVLSSIHSDTENSIDLRLANEILSIDTTTTNDSNTTNTSMAPSLSSLSSPSSSETNSFSSYKETTSSPASQRQERLSNRYSSIMQNSKLTERIETCSDNEDEKFCENGINNKLNSEKNETESHSSSKRKCYFSYNGFASEKDESGRVRELNSDTSAIGSDTDMETDDTDSITGSNTEKSAKLKRGNHPLLSDKLYSKYPADDSSSNNNNNNTKSKNTQRNTDGLLSIAIKTIKLVKRNHLLQQRLTQLQLETTEFIQSVLANPENRNFCENIKQKV